MEIGSEFHNRSVNYSKNKYFKLSDYSRRYVLSGRTGLGLIAKEMKFILKNILMPDYCCGSMIAPFVHQGFTVSFYSVSDLNDVVLNDTAEAVLIMDYFGFVSEDTLAFAQRCKSNGKIIIVDATQTAFSHSKIYELADYIVASYRKWFDSLCAVVYSKRGFVQEESNHNYDRYTDTFRKASVLKEEYIKHSKGEKQEFLSLYATANQLLDSCYDIFTASDSEVDIVYRADSDFLIKRRRENAQLLMSAVKSMSGIYDISLIYNDMGDEDCPLFVPILVNEKKRAFIRKKMIEDNIYCPCHWPIDSRYPYKETLYSRKELSLICDQRYGAQEMSVQIESLARALEALDCVTV